MLTKSTTPSAASLKPKSSTPSADSSSATSAASPSQVSRSISTATNSRSKKRTAAGSFNSKSSTNHPSASPETEKLPNYLALANRPFTAFQSTLLNHASMY